MVGRLKAESKVISATNPQACCLMTCLCPLYHSRISFQYMCSRSSDGEYLLSSLFFCSSKGVNEALCPSLRVGRQSEDYYLSFETISLKNLFRLGVCQSLCVFEAALVWRSSLTREFNRIVWVASLPCLSPISPSSRKAQGKRHLLSLAHIILKLPFTISKEPS